MKKSDPSPPQSLQGLLEKFLIIFRENFWYLVRYGTVAIVSYPLLFVGTYWLVDRWHWSPGWAYFVLLSLIYVGVYVSYTHFVFRVKFSHERLVKFVIVLVAIWGLNNLFFNLLNYFFHIPYLMVILLNLLIFGGLKFMAQRFFVFR